MLQQNPAPAAEALRRERGAEFLHEARFYEKLQSGKVRCTLCPRQCTLSEQARGHCGVRQNRGGSLYSLVYGRVCAAHVDPIEKKPLFHYLPGTKAFSIAAAGCNVHCKFCQNWQISQSPPEEIPSEYAPPQRIVEWATRAECPTIAYTYSEPAVWPEFWMDTADAAQDAGIRSIVVSNGYVGREALRKAYSKMDAIKIDLKSFNDSFYENIVRGRRQPVLDAIVTLRKMDKWVEIVYLVIPGLNDADEEFRALAKWMKEHLGPDVPVHFTRYHPDYLLKDVPATPVETLEHAQAAARAEGLHFAYVGNVPGHAGENTYCPRCEHLLVERAGMSMVRNFMNNGACPQCGCAIAGVWQSEAHAQ